MEPFPNNSIPKMSDLFEPLENAIKRSVNSGSDRMRDTVNDAERQNTSSYFGSLFKGGDP